MLQIQICTAQCFKFAEEVRKFTQRTFMIPTTEQEKRRTKQQISLLFEQYTRPLSTPSHFGKYTQRRRPTEKISERKQNRQTPTDVSNKIWIYYYSIYGLGTRQCYMLSQMPKRFRSHRSSNLYSPVEMDSIPKQNEMNERIERKQILDMYDIVFTTNNATADCRRNMCRAL